MNEEKQPVKKSVFDGFIQVSCCLSFARKVGRAEADLDAAAHPAFATVA